MKKALIAIVVIALIAVFTKPSDEKMKSRVSSEIMKDAKNNSPLAASIGSMFLEKMSKVNDYVFFKTVTVTAMGETKQVAWGAFGYINVKDSE